MKRREFVSLLGGTATVWSLVGGTRDRLMLQYQTEEK